jgi:2-(1,2-epoxy-1,2-dihydrophenyl)acetyl-CoA isomerase
LNKTILLSIEDDVAFCTFNRPKAMNTYNDVMSIELLETIREVNENSTLRFLVLRGADNKFMAGGDIAFFAKNLATMPSGVPEIIDRLNETISLLQSMDKINISVVEGACAGVGISFMLASDIVLVSNRSKFNTGYSALGLTPDGGMSYFLTRHVGQKKALELLLSSEPISASEALSLGLVNQVCDTEDIEPITNSVLQSLRQKSQQALLGCKRLVSDSYTQSLSEQLAKEKASFIALSQTQAFKDNVMTFIKK